MNDTELKLKLAEYLPEELHVYTNHYSDGKTLFWGKPTDEKTWAVEDAELLEICDRIEERMTQDQMNMYWDLLAESCGIKGNIMATWQQRATAIIQTLGTK